MTTNEQGQQQELIDQHNDLLHQVCQKQGRDDAAKFEIAYNEATGFFDRAGGSYDAETVRLMIQGYKGILAGEKPQFACNPNPYDGVWK